MKWMALFLVLAGCSSTPVQKSLDQIGPGMDKDQVLEKAGNPKRTYREEMQDHWIYVYFTDQKEWHREVVFESGKVVKVTSPTGKEQWEKDLDKANTMEEFEQKAREHQDPKRLPPVEPAGSP